MKLSNLLLFLGVFSLSVSYGQTRMPNAVEAESNQPVQKELTPAEETQALLAALEGTYEIQVSQQGYHPLITKDMLDTIAAARLPEDNATIEWDQYTTIIVFPGSAILQDSE